jgi:hypothetical protein
MYKDILRTMAGIEVFPIVSLLLFVVVFAAMLVWTARLDRAHLARLSSLPLEGGDDAASAPAGDAHSRSRQ